MLCPHCGYNCGPENFIWDSALKAILHRHGLCAIAGKVTCYRHTTRLKLTRCDASVGDLIIDMPGGVQIAVPDVETLRAPQTIARIALECK